jgi:hypothetical protein
VSDARRAGGVSGTRRRCGRCQRRGLGVVSGTQRRCGRGQARGVSDIGLTGGGWHAAALRAVVGTRALERCQRHRL